MDGGNGGCKINRAFCAILGSNRRRRWRAFFFFFSRCVCVKSRLHPGRRPRRGQDILHGTCGPKKKILTHQTATESTFVMRAPCVYMGSQISLHGIARVSKQHTAPPGRREKNERASKIFSLFQRMGVVFGWFNRVAKGVPSLVTRGDVEEPTTPHACTSEAACAVHIHAHMRPPQDENRVPRREKTENTDACTYTYHKKQDVCENQC